MKRIPSETIGTIDLDHEQLLVLLDRSGTRVRVLSGGVWLTEEGEPDDRFARRGEELLLKAHGRTVLEGIGQARIEVLQQQPVRPAQRLRERIAALREHFAVRRGGPSLVLVRSLASVVSLVLALGLPHLVARGFQQNAALLPAAAAGPQA